MINKKRKFVYTYDLTCPATLAGKIGEVRTLHVDDANMLKVKGYGYIESEGPPPKVAPIEKEVDIEIINARSIEPVKSTPPVEDIEITNARAMEPIKSTPPTEDIEITNARKVKSLQPQTVECDPEMVSDDLFVPEPEVTITQKEVKDAKSVRNKRKPASSEE